MEKLNKLRAFLTSSGFVNVDGIIASCASELLTSKARANAASIMESWTVEELKEAATPFNKPGETANNRSNNKDMRRK